MPQAQDIEGQNVVVGDADQPLQQPASKSNQPKPPSTEAPTIQSTSSKIAKNAGEAPENQEQYRVEDLIADLQEIKLPQQ